jgi:cytoskeletal protein CcmA (bactofilin family)
MNSKTIAKLSALFVVLLFAAVSAFAQGLSTVYVDVTNGSDTYTGANPTNSPAGSGPKASINAGLGALANNGTLVIFAGTYNGGDNAGGDVNINTTTYTRLTTGLTIEVRQLGGNNEVLLSAGNFMYNVSGGTLTVTSTGGTEYFNIAAGNLTLGSATNNSTVAIASSATFRIRSGGTITIWGTSGFSNLAPQKGTNLSLVYNGGGSFTAGPEAAYGSYGTGTLTVNKSAGTSVTFPAAMTFTGFATGTGDGADNVIVVSGGDAVFSGAVTIGATATTGGGPFAGDIIVSGSSNARFNGPVTLTVLGGAAGAAGDISNIENSGTGTVAFNAGVTWNAASNAATRTFASGAGTSIVLNTAGGSVTFASTVTLSTSTVSTSTDADVILTVNIDNTAAGTVSFSQPIAAANTTASPTGTTRNRNFVISGTNSAAGSLTISGTLRGSVTNAAGGSVTINGATTISGSLVNASTGTVAINAATTITGALTNTAAASGSITITAATSVGGVLTNGAGKTITLGGNVLTLSGNVAHLTNGGSITASTGGGLNLTNTGAASFNGGTLSNVTMSGSGTTTFGTNAITVTNLTASGGTLTVAIGTVASSVTVSGGTLTVSNAVTLRTTNFTQSGGTVTLGGGASGTLRVDGDLNRTAGTFTAAAGSTLSFQGSSTQNLNGGPLFQVVNLTFNNTGGTITLGQSIRASGTVTIAAGTNLALGTLNIILNSAAASMSNSGTYTASGGGGVVIGGATTIGSGGFAGNGINIAAAGTGQYSFITVDVGAGNWASVSGTAARFTGNLTLVTGELRITDGSDFGPAGSSARIIRNVESSAGITIPGTGTFNTANVQYDLEYIGTLTANRATGSELNANARSWTINVNGDPDGDGDISTGAQRFVELPGATSTVFAGPLTIGRLASVRIATNAANVSFELSGTGITHTIAGQLTTADAGDDILVSGASVTINGSTATADYAAIGNIRISSATGCTISNVQAFLGTFTTMAGSVVRLGMGSTNATSAVLPTEQRIAGAVTLGGSSLTLTSNIEARAGVAFNAGALNFGTFNLQLTTAGDFTQGGGAAGYTSGGGFLVMNRAGAALTIGNAAATALPNLRVLANTTLAASGRVSGLLDIGVSTAAMPTLTLGANNLTFTGTAINVDATGAGTAVVSDGVAGDAGDLIITGSAVTITANTGVTIEELDYNPGGAGTGTGTLTFASTSATTGRTFIISDEFTTVGTSVTVATGINVLSLEGDATTPHVLGANTTVTSTGDGWLQLNGTAAGILSSVTSSTTRPVVQKLRVSAAATLTATHRLRVTNALDLTAGAFTVSANLLELGDGTNPITITRRLNSATLANAATFTSGSAVDVVYVQVDNTGNADIVMGNEAPASIRNLTINNRDVDATQDNVTLNASKTVTGTLFLVAGELDVAGFTLTIGAGGTINRSGGRFETTGGQTDAPTVTSYNLIYSSGTGITPGTEFRTGIINLTVQSSAVPAATTLNLTSSATLTGNLTLNSDGGGINLSGFNLTVQGNVTVTAGSFTNSSATTTSELRLAGSTAQTITVPSAGLTLPYATQAVSLRLNNAAGFTLTGGNLSMSTNTGRTAGGIIYFDNGVLNAGTLSVVLGQTTTGQGFQRTNGWVLGNVRHSIPGGAGSPTVYANGRFEFPVGSATQYRPAAIVFTSSYPANNPTTIDVRHVDASPEGSRGLPVLDPSTNKRIGGYPGFYWLVSTTTSMGAQAFDVEVVGTNLGRPFTDVSDLRIIRRFDGSADINTWSIQGSGANYSNILATPTPGDSIVTVRTTQSTGGIVTQGARFTIGIPTRPPSFTLAPATATVNENSQLSLQYTAIPNDVGETITYSLVNPPSGASIHPSTGVFTWTPTYAQAGNYTITVSATDGEFTVTTTTAVTVVNVNRKPVFTAVSARTITDKDTLKVQLQATDPDGDALTYSFVSIVPTASANPTVSATGALQWKPVFADAGRTYTIRARVTDGVSTGAGEVPGVDTVSISVTVNRSRVRGDVSGDGTISAFDASLVLQHVTGIAVLTDPAALYAADASNNGTISAFDAALILQHVAGIIRIPPVAGGQSGASLRKVDGSTIDAAPLGSVSWTSPAATEVPEVITMGLKTSSDASGVYAIEVVSAINESMVSVENVASKLPSDWQLFYHVANGELRIAMAGVTPIAGGEFATVTFRLKDKAARVNFTSSTMLNERASSTDAVELAAVPTVFQLEQNYPNPFNPSTTIKYQIPQQSSVMLVIYNVQGQKVRTLVSEEQKAGFYSLQWDGKNDAGVLVSSGFYIYRIQAGTFNATQKMLLMK